MAKAMTPAGNEIHHGSGMKKATAHAAIKTRANIVSFMPALSSNGFTVSLHRALDRIGEQLRKTLRASVRTVL